MHVGHRARSLCTSRGRISPRSGLLTGDLRNSTGPVLPEHWHMHGVEEFRMRRRWWHAYRNRRCCLYDHFLCVGCRCLLSPPGRLQDPARQRMHCSRRRICRYGTILHHLHVCNHARQRRLLPVQRHLRGDEPGRMQNTGWHPPGTPGSMFHHGRTGQYAANMSSGTCMLHAKRRLQRPNRSGM